jgi:hypothetical protein
MDVIAASWPPGAEDRALLEILRELIARGGAGRFLDARLVAADRADFPEPWKATRAAVERLIARLLWHAHVDLDVTIEDVRSGEPEGDMLRRSVIEWLGNEDGAAVFHLEQIGNDDVAGLLVHEIGRAFVAWIGGGDPYRDVAREPSLVEGSVAAIYLGLGVLAANSATKRRGTSEIRGNQVAWEYDIEVRGGITTRAAVYLLAAQQVAREHEATALATLDPRLIAPLAEQVDALRPHRAALLELLELDPATPRPALERDPAPPAVTDAERPEPALRAANAGRPVFRVPHRKTLPYSAAGLALTGAGLIVAADVGVMAPFAVLAGVLAAGGLGGGVFGRRQRYDECATCERVAPPDAATCPGCGGTFRGEIKHRDERLAKEDELETWAWLPARASRRGRRRWPSAPPGSARSGPAGERRRSRGRRAAGAADRSPRGPHPDRWRA